MIIQVNENNYVVGYATAGTMQGVVYNGEVTEHFLENSRYYKYENEELKFDEEKYNEDIAKQEEASAKYQEISELETWFVYYDKQVSEYERDVRLGQTYDKDLEELDKQAEINKARLKELES